MLTFQGKDGELRIIERGDLHPEGMKIPTQIGGVTVHYCEVLFSEMDFTGPLSRKRPEERVILDRGLLDSNTHYVQGDDIPITEALPLSFSCKLSDQTSGYSNSTILYEILSGVTQVSANSGETTLYSTKNFTHNYLVSGAGTNVSTQAFVDGYKQTYTIECLWDGANDKGIRVKEVYFKPGECTLTESADNLILNVNAEVYSEVTAITAFTTAYSANSSASGVSQLR